MNTYNFQKGYITSLVEAPSTGSCNVLIQDTSEGIYPVAPIGIHKFLGTMHSACCPVLTGHTHSGMHFTSS